MTGRSLSSPIEPSIAMQTSPGRDRATRLPAGGRERVVVARRPAGERTQDRAHRCRRSRHRPRAAGRRARSRLADRLAAKASSSSIACEALAEPSHCMWRVPSPSSAPGTSAADSKRRMAGSSGRVIALGAIRPVAASRLSAEVLIDGRADGRVVGSADRSRNEDCDDGGRSKPRKRARPPDHSAAASVGTATSTTPSTTRVAKAGSGMLAGPPSTWPVRTSKAAP